MSGKVLFVDDDRNIRSALERLFYDDDDISVMTASGAVAALQILESEPADIVVSDQMMPEMDGITLLREIRRRHPATRVMMLTGYGEAMADEIESELGPDFPVFGKPWNVENLRQAIRRILQDCTEKTVATDSSDSLIGNPTNQGTQGMLAAGLAHEIRGPLGFIRSNMEILNQYSERIRELLGLYEQMEQRLAVDDTYADLRNELKVYRDAARLDFILQDQETLIQQSLDGTSLIADITSALGALSPSADCDHRADVRECFERALLIARYEVKHSVVIVRELQENACVRCNGTELTQILLNLLINAAEAVNEQGTVTVRASLQNDQVALEIEDDGCGIAEEHRGRIFEPFFTTKDSVAGLGLPLVSELVRRNDGLIGVRSGVGQGTCFRVELPATTSHEDLNR